MMPSRKHGQPTIAASTSTPQDIKRLRALEGENPRLKKLLAERELAIDVLKEINHRKW